MRTDTFTLEPLIGLLRRQTVASLPQITAALGAPSPRTVCRKLAQAGCRSSYSHCGRYYTLDELADYDEHGLWNWQGRRFSLHGSLLATAAHLTDISAAGYRAAELSERVGVQTYGALCKLAERGQVSRARVGGQAVFCSVSRTQRQRQLRARRIQCAPALAPPRTAAADPDPRVTAATATLFGVLDERQRRLFAGLESLRCGHGGDRAAAASLGLSAETVGAGRRQLLAGGLDPTRIRRPGGGRKRAEKKTPDSSS